MYTWLPLCGDAPLCHLCVLIKWLPKLQWDCSGNLTWFWVACQPTCAHLIGVTTSLPRVVCHSSASLLIKAQKARKQNHSDLFFRIFFIKKTNTVLLKTGSHSGRKGLVARTGIPHVSSPQVDTIRPKVWRSVLVVQSQPPPAAPSAGTEALMVGFWWTEWSEWSSSQMFHSKVKMEQHLWWTWRKL